MNTKKIKKIALRLDDFHQNCNLEKWDFIVQELMKRKIPVHIGLIPINNDPNIVTKRFNFNHWELANLWQSKGVNFWIHGLNHKLNNGKCEISLSNKGEFFNEDFNMIEYKLSKSISLFQSNGIKIRGYMAPAHGYSKELLNIIRKNKYIKVIWDGFWPSPKKYKNINFIPQQFWKIYPIFLLPHFSGICIHPSEMTFDEIKFLIKKIDKLDLEIFQFNLDEINFKRINIFDYIYIIIYRTIRFFKTF